MSIAFHLVEIAGAALLVWMQLNQIALPDSRNLPRPIRGSR